MRLHYKNGEISGYFHTLRAVTRNPEDDGKGLCWDIMICCGTSLASVLRNSVNDIMGLVGKRYNLALCITGVA